MLIKYSGLLEQKYINRKQCKSFVEVLTRDCGASTISGEECHSFFYSCEGDHNFEIQYGLGNVDEPKFLQFSVYIFNSKRFKEIQKSSQYIIPKDIQELIPAEFIISRKISKGYKQKAKQHHDTQK